MNIGLWNVIESIANEKEALYCLRYPLFNNVVQSIEESYSSAYLTCNKNGVSTAKLEDAYKKAKNDLVTTCGNLENSSGAAKKKDTREFEITLRKQLELPVTNFSNVAQQMSISKGKIPR